MTLFEAEPETIPGPPGVSALTETLAGLLAASRADGQQHGTILERGLRLRVGTAEGEFIALSRAQGRPGEDEGDLVARAAGWTHWGATWDEHGGRWYLILKPEDPPPADVAPVKTKAKGDPEPPPPPEDPEFPDDVIRAALTDRAAPWSGSMAPWMLDSRTEAVKGMKRVELLEEISWLRRKFGPQLQAWKRARIAAALR